MVRVILRYRASTMNTLESTDPQFEPALSSLLELLPDPHLALSNSGDVLASNTALTQQLGVHKPALFEALRHNFQSQSPNAQTPVSLVITTDNEPECEVELLARPLGQTAWMVRVRVLEETSSALQDALKRREEDLNAALCGGVIGFWRYDIANQTYTLHGEYLNWMGRNPSADTVTGDQWRHALSEADIAIAETMMQQMLDTGEIAQCEIALNTPRGQRWVRVQGKPIQFDEHGNPSTVAGVMLDIAQERDITAKLKARTQALERSTRELNRFSIMAAHDLQEPLRKISAFASLLRRQYEGQLDTDADHSLDFLVDAAGRMRSLIDDLLTYSNISTCQLTPRQLDLNELVADVLDIHAREFSQENVQIVYDPLPTLIGDAPLLQQLFEHLITNALKFRKPDGVNIRIRTRLQDQHWVFDVIDDGIGFDPKFTDKVFAPFGRLHHRDAYSGNGVGLAICQQAVERHGGHIHVESAEGAGSTFTFTLPTDPSSFIVESLVDPEIETPPCG